ncbi:type I DNA topoisomerase [Tautonia plasticadhaerens]|uniref:DNA topoisomerase 1 n=1 Tax=Tautonia plasticadhaerens TaxID=2527974 RepID=A0A518H8W8_9BACT|nr:type I DNA topoisomerase [Tautonia plasticadhaerens]QDV37298.1 DNA topoisomerase 1 [Tautonia plasticadhaerens]
MNVVIVESPAKCRTINKYLGNEYQVLASFGHIRDLPPKDGSVRPDEDFSMDYEIQPGSTKAVKAIVDAVKEADELILATDPDREGEAISWHVLEALRQKRALRKDLPVRRVVFNSITKDAILEAMAHPRDIDMALVNAQQARRALDYLVGFSLSPVLWRKLPGSKSAGRVQSVALRLICDREDDIERFVSQEYWDVRGAFLKQNEAKSRFLARLTHFEGKKLDKFDIPKQAEADRVVAGLKDKPYRVRSVERKQVRRNPNPPFTTSTVQQEASRKLGFGAKRTMQVAQRLYESGRITYMRTDGVDIAPEALRAIREQIDGQFGKEYLPDSPRVYKSKAANAQEAHEAIRPTDLTRLPQAVAKEVDADESRLYDLIWKRTMASQMATAVFDQVVAEIDAEDRSATLRAVGTTMKFDGFLKLYIEGKDDSSDEDDESGALPPLGDGEAVDLADLIPAQHFTEPPPRYTEASLVKRMEELGIGRPSTYASIISILQDRDYVKLDSKRFIPEPRGRVVTAFLTHFFRRYVEYDFTANLENELDLVSDGQVDWKQVLRSFWENFAVNVEKAKGLEITNVISELNEALASLLFPGEGSLEERRKCPSCGAGQLSLKIGKYGAFVGCSNYPECRFTRELTKDKDKGDGTGDGDGSNAPVEPKVLGEDAEGQAISVRKGPYGFYVQLGEGKKPKRVSIPKGTDPESVDLERGRGLLALPRTLGKHPETNKVVKAGSGLYGPYVLHSGKYTTLKPEDDVLAIDLDRAVKLIAEAPKKRGAEPIKELGNHPEDDQPVSVFEGRYGPYVKHGKVNATIPKDRTPDQITLDEAIPLLKEAADRKGTGGGRRKAAGKGKSKS